MPCSVMVSGFVVYLVLLVCAVGVMNVLSTNSRSSNCLFKTHVQLFIYLLETAHPRTTKQLTRTYNTASSTSQTYYTQFSPDM